MRQATGSSGLGGSDGSPCLSGLNCHTPSSCENGPSTSLSLTTSPCTCSLRVVNDWRTPAYDNPRRAVMPAGAPVAGSASCRSSTVLASHHGRNLGESSTATTSSYI